MTVPKHITILVPRGSAAVSCIEGSYTLFSRVNDFLQAEGKPPAFEIQLAGLDTNPRVYDRFIQIKPDLAAEDIDRTDLVIIPAVNGDWKTVISDNEVFFPWIRRMYHQGAGVASLCVGAFLLAATGLADGKSCSTHWMAAGELSRMFPRVKVVSDRVITEEQGIYTSGGASSFWSLLLYLLEKMTGREMAVTASKYFALDITRHSQSPFMVFSAQKDHTDDAIRNTQEFIEKNFRGKITIGELSEQFAIGRRSLERRFKKATGNTVNEYITRVKIEAAKKNLENGTKNVNEVMFEVGYNDTKAFRAMFRKHTGLSPLEYRKRYNPGSYEPMLQ